MLEAGVSWLLLALCLLLVEELVNVFFGCSCQTQRQEGIRIHCPISTAEREVMCVCLQAQQLTRFRRIVESEM